MRAAVAVLVLFLFAGAPSLSRAFPIQVTITVTTGPQLTQVARGAFIFDSSYFVQQPSDPETYFYHGFVPVSSLEDAGLDWFAGPLAGTHWDVLGYLGTDHMVVDYKAPLDLGRYTLGHPGYDWGWQADIGGYIHSGGDGLTLFEVDGDYYTAQWTGQAIPEPAGWAVFLVGAGLVATFRGDARR